MPGPEKDGPSHVLSDLHEELLGLLPLPTAFGLLYLLLFPEHVFGITPRSALILGLTVALTSGLAQWLRARSVPLAAWIYLAGLAAAWFAMTWVSFSPTATALFPMVVLLSMALLGPRSMAIATGTGVIALLVAAHHHLALNDAVIAPIGAICLSALVAWVSNRNQARAVEWAWNSFQQARRSTEEARAHRAELARTLKALDEAYYRLERFSAQLAAAREAAEEARRAKQQFVATVSHELRTPLNIIIGFAELIALSPESYGVRRVPRQLMGDVNRIFRSAQHLKGLIDDVLDLSQIDARHMFLLTEQASLPEVIAEASDMVWSLAQHKGLALNVDVPQTLPLLSFDRLRIRQVILNLLSNAVRFTERGEISVLARLEGKAVQVTVSDTGPGIAAEDLGRVFEEFRQLDQTLSRRHEGTGLGLALSRRFIELHGGRMWAESEVGVGSRFHFSLPLAPAAPAPPPRGPLPLPAAIEAHSTRTLLVDSPEPMVANLLRRHLRGYRVESAKAGELQQAVDSLLPQAVIRNSLAPVQEPDEAPRSGPLPVPVITCPLPDPAYLGRTLGVDRYLVKPVTRERLLALLAGYGDTVRRILIVDDDAQLAELIARTVRAAGHPYTVDVACGGEEGLARMRECRPDLVLLDLVMAGLDGLAVLRLMRADERLRTVPVVIVTARDLPGEEARLPGESGISLQVPASLTVTEVLSCVQALLDTLPPPRPASSPPPRPAAAPPGPQAS